MSELVFSKELLPLLDGRPVVQHSIQAMRQVTDELVAFVNYRKTDLIAYLTNQGVHVVTGVSKSLPESIYRAAQAVGDFDTLLFALPDTYYGPDDVFVQLAAHQEPNVLGLFETSTPERYDSVRMYRDRIVDYVVKQKPALSSWTMGCGKLSNDAMAVINPEGSNKDEPLLGDGLSRLAKDKQLYGIRLQDSQYHDLGTPETYITYVLERFGSDHIRS